MDTLGKINLYIVNPLIFLLIGIAVVFFLFGLIEFIASSDSTDGRDNGRRHLLWGIVGLFIIFSVYGIINLIQNTLVGLFT